MPEPAANRGVGHRKALDALGQDLTARDDTQLIVVVQRVGHTDRGGFHVARHNNHRRSQRRTVAIARQDEDIVPKVAWLKR